MDLQISLFLLFALFTAGHSLSCYQCPTLSGFCGQANCSSENANCYAITAYAGESIVPFKSCISPTACFNGSANFGIIRAFSYCCNTDGCNANDAPVTNTTPANGKSCYYCDGQNCTQTVSCSGTEDRCVTGTLPSTPVYKGCVSKSLCDATAFIPTLSNFTCCEGNLCNGAVSVTQSFLFLCSSLLSFILMA